MRISPAHAMRLDPVPLLGQGGRMLGLLVDSPVGRERVRLCPDRQLSGWPPQT